MELTLEKRKKIKNIKQQQKKTTFLIFMRRIIL